ncbi:MAG: class I SAM-dependent methyltransferase [Actinomycetota bacterium]
MRFDLGAARRVFESYAGSPLGARAYVAGRLVVAPLGELGREAATLRGRVLSLGSGVGVVERYLAEVNPSLQIQGVDLDQEKVDLVAATSARCPRVSLRRADATALDDGPESYDAVLV